MSATVTYKGNTLTTVNNETKILETAGTWLEDDITIVDVNQPGPAIIVDTSDSNGGTIRTITTGSAAVLQSGVTVTPGGTAQTITPSSGYDGFTDITVEATPSTLYQYVHGTVNGPYIDNDLTSLPAFVFYRNRGGITDIRIPNATSIGQQACYLAGINTFFAPKAQVGAESLYGIHGPTIVCSGASVNGNSRPIARYSTDSLTSVDLVYKGSYGLTGNMFQNRALLVTLILRENAIYPMYATSAFDGTPFASGSTGGTIYIPKYLYDHLGDGTALDYKAATNWSTINGYGTITWAQIEGSIYETQYVDGTPLPTD